MIDLSCHILHGTACGPGSFAQSLEMCRSAVEDKIKMIVATPRWEAGSVAPPLPFDACRRGLDQLQSEMGDALSFRLGFMMQYSPHLPSLADQYGAKLALGGARHLLVSLPASGRLAGTEEVWRQLSRRGFIVLIARPECNPILRQQPERLDGWVAEGVEVQVDAASVTGDHGRDVQRFALRCLEHYSDRTVLASNSRATSSKRPSLALASGKVEKEFGPRHARALVQDRPAEILNGVAKHREPSRKIAPRDPHFSALSFLRRKKTGLEKT